MKLMAGYLILPAHLTVLSTNLATYYTTLSATEPLRPHLSAHVRSCAIEWNNLTK